MNSTIADDTRTAEGFPVKDRFVLIQSEHDQGYVNIDRMFAVTKPAIHRWQAHEPFLLTLLEAQQMMKLARRHYPDHTVMIVHAADWQAIERKTLGLRKAGRPH